MTIRTTFLGNSNDANFFLVEDTGNKNEYALIEQSQSLGSVKSSCTCMLDRTYLSLVYKNGFYSEDLCSTPGHVMNNLSGRIEAKSQHVQVFAADGSSVCLDGDIRKFVKELIDRTKTLKK